ncbi:MAG TPA: DUF2298 domain-containing protein, partial [Chloroflexota bacterium]|nr:DUF2298 domain-containing protein [Chloroflexota bacterium]
MFSALWWWLVVQVIALCATPLCLALFRPLADRGYGLSKAFGLLVFGYAVWLIGVLQLLPNGWGAYLLAFLLIGVGSYLVWRRETAEAGGNAASLLAFFRRRRGLLLIEEGIFLFVFLGFLFIRSYNADIAGTEKFMDFAFMNAVTRSESFPPLDPWLAPSPTVPKPTINYYYFGYLIQGLLLSISGLPPAEGFNLALSLIFGLAAVGAFSLVYGLARDTVAEGQGARIRGKGSSAQPGQGDQSSVVGRRLSVRPIPSWSFKAARPYVVAGALGAYMLLVAGNLWSALRRFDGSGMWEKDFWQGIGWNATRVLVIKQGDRDIDYTINEFPAFSFLLGDLHPHVLALPFVILAVGLAYRWLMQPPLLFRHAIAGEALEVSGDAPSDEAPWRNGARRLAPVAELLPGAMILGSLYFLNSWDFPAYFALAQACAIAGAWWLGLREEVGISWARTIGVVALVGLLAIVLFLPFHLNFKPPVVAEGGGLPLGLVTQRSQLGQFVQFWG